MRRASTVRPCASSATTRRLAIKREPRTRHIPVFVVTILDNRQKALSLGADDFTTKPVDRGWLVKTLRQVEGEYQRATVLLIDDDEVSRYLLAGHLADTFTRVIQAASGAEGLEAARTRQPAAIFLDLMMPEMDGFEVLSRIKQDPATRDIPVIVISALDDLSAAVRCIEQGAEDFLSKPFEPVLLKARVGASLEKKRLRDRERAYLKDVDRVLGAAGAVEAGTYQAGSLADVARRADALGKPLAEQGDAAAQKTLNRLRGEAESPPEHVEPAAPEPPNDVPQETAAPEPLVIKHFRKQDELSQKAIDEFHADLVGAID